MTPALFAGFGALLVASSLLVILHKNPVTSALYLDKRDDVAHYLEVMNHLSTEALTPPQSVKFITEIIRDM